MQISAQQQITLPKQSTRQIQYNKYYKNPNISPYPTLPSLPSMKQNQQQICKNPTQHKSLKQYNICLTCASTSTNISYICFCKKCYDDKYKRHKDHKQLCHFDSLMFNKKFKAFRDYLQNNKGLLQNAKNDFVNKLLSGEEIDFRNMGVVKWLVSAKFWKFDDRRTERDAAEYFQNLLNIHVATEEPSKQESSQGLIDWGKYSDDNGQQPIKKMLQQAQKQKQSLINQQKIIQTLLQVQSCLTKNSKLQAMQTLNKTIEEFPKSTLLLLIKLYIMELHEGNISEWQPILKKIVELKVNEKDNSFRESPMYYFIDSHRCWVKVNKEEFSKIEAVKYVDAVTGNFFVLKEPHKYVELFNRALLGHNKCAVLLGCKSLGLIAQNMYVQASKCLQIASEGQSFKINNLFCKYKQRQLSTEELNILTDQLQNRSKQYILNAIKLLKHLKQPEQIVNCCQVLHNQQNQCASSKIQLATALLKLDKVQDASQVCKELQKQGIPKQISNRLQRKIKYCEARHYLSQNNNNKAQQKYKQLIVDKKSGSSFYNLAVLMYNKQKYDDAEEYINKALQQKKNVKYYKLKLYIMLMKKDMESAYQILEFLNEGSIDAKIRDMLLQFGNK